MDRDTEMAALNHQQELEHQQWLALEEASVLLFDTVNNMIRERIQNDQADNS